MLGKFGLGSTEFAAIQKPRYEQQPPSLLEGVVQRVDLVGCSTGTKHIPEIIETVSDNSTSNSRLKLTMFMYISQ